MHSTHTSLADTVHDLTGLYSVYTNWRNIEIMFHVSTQLPYEKHDPQKLQRKRHIGNDIVVFIEADNTSFSPACIKSHFLHTFILVSRFAFFVSCFVIHFVDALGTRICTN